jgi:hypothetical protein
MLRGNYRHAMICSECNVLLLFPGPIPCSLWLSPVSLFDCQSLCGWITLSGASVVVVWLSVLLALSVASDVHIYTTVSPLIFNFSPSRSFSDFPFNHTHPFPTYLKTTKMAGMFVGKKQWYRRGSIFLLAKFLCQLEWNVTSGFLNPHTLQDLVSLDHSYCFLHTYFTSL